MSKQEQELGERIMRLILRMFAEGRLQFRTRVEKTRFNATKASERLRRLVA